MIVKRYHAELNMTVGEYTTADHVTDVTGQI